MKLMRETSGPPFSTAAVFGLGYVGSVTAACLASIGHRVIGIDSDAHKVECLNAGKAPFFEPGLEEIIRDSAAAGRLSATLNTEEALADADVALICVGTPSERNGNLGLDQLRRVCQGIAEVTRSREKPLVVAIRSTRGRNPARQGADEGLAADRARIVGRARPATRATDASSMDGR